MCNHLTSACNQMPGGIQLACLSWNLATSHSPYSSHLQLCCRCLKRRRHQMRQRACDRLGAIALARSRLRLQRMHAAHGGTVHCRRTGARRLRPWQRPSKRAIRRRCESTLAHVSGLRGSHGRGASVASTVSRASWAGAYNAAERVHSCALRVRFVHDSYPHLQQAATNPTFRAQ